MSFDDDEQVKPPFPWTYSNQGDDVHRIQDNNHLSAADLMNEATSTAPELQKIKQPELPHYTPAPASPPDARSKQKVKDLPASREKQTKANKIKLILSKHTTAIKEKDKREVPKPQPSKLAKDKPTPTQTKTEPPVSKAKEKDKREVPKPQPSKLAKDKTTPTQTKTEPPVSKAPPKSVSPLPKGKVSSFLNRLTSKRPTGNTIEQQNKPKSSEPVTTSKTQSPLATPAKQPQQAQQSSKGPSPPDPPSPTSPQSIKNQPPSPSTPTSGPTASKPEPPTTVHSPITQGVPSPKAPPTSAPPSGATKPSSPTTSPPKPPGASASSQPPSTPTIKSGTDDFDQRRQMRNESAKWVEEWKKLEERIRNQKAGKNEPQPKASSHLEKTPPQNPSGSTSGVGETKGASVGDPKGKASDKFAMPIDILDICDQANLSSPTIHSSPPLSTNQPTAHSTKPFSIQVPPLNSSPNYSLKYNGRIVNNEDSPEMEKLLEAKTVKNNSEIIEEKINQPPPPLHKPTNRKSKSFANRFMEILLGNAFKNKNGDNTTKFSCISNTDNGQDSSFILRPRLDPASSSVQKFPQNHHLKVMGASFSSTAKALELTRPLKLHSKIICLGAMMYLCMGVILYNKTKEELI